ncbi:MAG: ABC transporter substrate-binding protein [Deltaproteobacteria bacterium]|nr:ABC transporter substrate-binding protein [Deltaproteobacteria bacterium]
MQQRFNKVVVHVLGILFCSFFIGAASPSATPATAICPPATQTPTEAIKELDKMANQYRVGKNMTSADRAFNKQLKEKILRGTFDLRELARLSLDKYWNQRTLKEQTHFVELLTNLLEERSIFSKEKAADKGQNQPYVISYLGDVYQNKGKTEAYSKSIIRLKKRKAQVAIDYRLRKTAEGWKIYDVIMDGASLVDNYRFSFGSIIKKQGYPELVHRMETKLAEFKAKNT